MSNQDKVTAEILYEKYDDITKKHYATFMLDGFRFHQASVNSQSLAEQREKIVAEYMRQKVESLGDVHVILPDA